jgi:hypothetical protein
LPRARESVGCLCDRRVTAGCWLILINGNAVSFDDFCDVAG